MVKLERCLMNVQQEVSMELEQDVQLDGNF